MKIAVLENNTLVTLNDIKCGDVFISACDTNIPLPLEACVMMKTSYMEIRTDQKKRYLCVRLVDGVSFWCDSEDKICPIKNAELVIGERRKKI